MIVLKNKLVIAGIGPGNIDLVSQRVLECIEESEVLIGGRRNLDTYQQYGKIEFEIKNNLQEMITYINEYIETKKIVVLASGDPFLFGIASYLINNLVNIEIETISGISSIQYLASRVNMKWDDIYIKSIHGRNNNLEMILKHHYKVGLFTGKKPENVLNELNVKGFADWYVIVGENLSYKDEKITEGKVSELGGIKFSDLSVMILQNKNRDNNNSKWNYCTKGIIDELFVRGNVPMTKEEIRAIALSKLRLKPDSIVCDIGAGTGSVSVECGLHVPFGKVYAYERNREAVNLIRENCIAFCLNNVEIIEGNIGDISLIQPCSRAFIGGSGEYLDLVLDRLGENENIRVVINSVTIETTYEAMESLCKNGYHNIECISVSISKSSSAGKKHIMKAMNTVYIISGEKGVI